MGRCDGGSSPFILPQGSFAVAVQNTAIEISSVARCTVQRTVAVMMLATLLVLGAAGSSAVVGVMPHSMVQALRDL